MLEGGVRPDVVSCTALVAALGADGQWQRAERVVAWMLQVRVCIVLRFAGLRLQILCMCLRLAAC